MKQTELQFLKWIEYRLSNMCLSKEDEDVWREVTERINKLKDKKE